MSPFMGWILAIGTLVLFSMVLSLAAIGIALMCIGGFVLVGDLGTSSLSAGILVAAVLTTVGLAIWGMVSLFMRGGA